MAYNKNTKGISEVPPMNYPIVGKAFWLGLFNATFMSVPLWLLIYYSLRGLF